jgi:uncharacterized protein with PIN domain
MIDRPATLFFHGGLAVLLGRGVPGPEVAYPVVRRASVKDVIEALGPPHTEVGSIVVDGLEVGFGHPLSPGERVDIRPVEAPFDVTRPSVLRPLPLDRVAFLADANVGRLAGLLRALGVDTAHDPGLDDAGLARLAAEEGRVVLSRDFGLLKRKTVEFGRLVRAHDPSAQLHEILRVFGLRPPYRAFSRCVLCNAPLVPVPKADIVDRLLPLTRIHYHDFHLCPRCDKVYWPGSHHERMRERIDGIVRDLLA